MSTRLLLTLAVTATVIFAQQDSGKGVLLLAHGGSAAWNEEVARIAAQVSRSYPTEVAFGMATRRTMQDGIDKLAARGVKEIVAVPLFISSHSSVITSTEYLLGRRNEMPDDLKSFAKMDHSSHGAAASHVAPAADGTKPVTTTLPLRMTAALGHHRVVADILVDRANSISDDPTGEVAIVVAHGPNPDEDNRKWLADMRLLVERMKIKTRFHRIDYLTIRDDAPEPVASQAKEEFRRLVRAAKVEGKTALVVPMVLSYGGIEARLAKRLDGLEYRLASQGLLPDSRLAGWVIENIRR